MENNRRKMNVEHYGQASSWLVENNPKLNHHQIKKREDVTTSIKTKQKLGQLAINSQQLNNRNRNRQLGRVAINSIQQTHRVKER